MLGEIFDQTGQGFIFIIDEWDCVFRVAKEQKEIQKDYLDFLRGLLKGQDYVELAYMTGILPIKKYGEHSAINIFDEYSMIDPKNLGEFLGLPPQKRSGSVKSMIWIWTVSENGMTDICWIHCVFIIQSLFQMRLCGGIFTVTGPVRRHMKC